MNKSQTETNFNDVIVKPVEWRATSRRFAFIDLFVFVRKLLLCRDLRIFSYLVFDVTYHASYLELNCYLRIV